MAKAAAFVVAVVVLGFGSVAEATRKKHLRLKQHIAVQHELTSKAQIYTMCKDVFATPSCDQCIKKDAGWWAIGSKHKCAWSAEHGRCVEEPAAKTEGMLTTTDECENWEKEKKHQRRKHKLMNVLKATAKGFDKVKKGYYAPADPSLEPYNKFTHTKAQFQKMSGNKGYCWRYATSQSLGIPYLMYEQMLKTIQAYLADQGDAGAYEYLANPLTKDSNDAREDGGRARLMIEELKRFVLAHPDAIIYREIAKGVDPVSGKLGYKPMNNKKISGILHALIKCTQVAIMEKPTMKKMENFLGENPEKRRITFRMVGRHVVVLLYIKNWMGQNVLYLADGNGAAHDGELVPFKNGFIWYDKRNYFYHEIFQDWVDSGYKNDDEKSFGKDFQGFQAIKVSRDNCPKHDG